MSDLDKGYIISVDLSLEKRNNTIEFNLTDNMTSDIFINLTNRDKSIENIKNKVFYLFILNPHKNLQYVLLTKQNNYFYVDMESGKTYTFTFDNSNPNNRTVACTVSGEGSGTVTPIEKYCSFYLIGNLGSPVNPRV